MHLAVDVTARDLRGNGQRLATSCAVVFVALDSPDGKPTPVPHWEPRDDGERQLQARARELLELSSDMEQLVELDTPVVD